jgi:hypothetical protein
MCGICSVTTVPVCNLVGGCSVQTLDFLKVALMTGGAGGGTLMTFLKKGEEQDEK